MVRQLLVEVLENFHRLFRPAVARQPSAVSLHNAQRGRIELVGGLEARAGVLVIAGEIENEAGVQALEDRVPVRTRELVDQQDGVLGIVRAGHRPAGQQRRGEIGDRAARGLRQLGFRDRILLGLDRLDAKHDANVARRLVDLQQTLAELYGLLDIALGHQRLERKRQQFDILGIGPQRGAVISCRRGRIARDIGLTARKIIARHR